MEEHSKQFRGGKEPELIGTWLFNDVIYPQDLGETLGVRLPYVDDYNYFATYTINFNFEDYDYNKLLYGWEGETNTQSYIVLRTGLFGNRTGTIATDSLIYDSRLDSFDHSPSANEIESLIENGISATGKTIVLTGGDDINDIVLLQWFQANATKLY